MRVIDYSIQMSGWFIQNPGDTREMQVSWKVCHRPRDTTGTWCPWGTPQAPQAPGGHKHLGHQRHQGHHRHQQHLRHHRHHRHQRHPTELWIWKLAMTTMNMITLLSSDQRQRRKSTNHTFMYTHIHTLVIAMLPSNQTWQSHWRHKSCNLMATGM